MDPIDNLTRINQDPIDNDSLILFSFEYDSAHDSDVSSSWEEERHVTLENASANSDMAEDLENVTYHPVMNGRPCDSAGVFLPDHTPPPPWEDPQPDNFSPFSDLEDFTRGTRMSHRRNSVQVFTLWDKQAHPGVASATSTPPHSMHNLLVPAVLYR
ncbi:hypothetical protein M378DRAFT_16338 [Amanita muscaria Koide BX008]|uniref:Uncharacterized protein n=1 Tax=Amanita muscaria (strain Koide BX008) TaxID=946122 RepID=A0A0C2S3T5_AMAMK|nr:hypothetical protein M378DRAFT_16338 [Amanita muscaria Koide BX008]